MEHNATRVARDHRSVAAIVATMASGIPVQADATMQPYGDHDAISASLTAPRAIRCAERPLW
jgi:hypothetical protein